MSASTAIGSIEDLDFWQNRDMRIIRRFLNDARHSTKTQISRFEFTSHVNDSGCRGQASQSLLSNRSQIDRGERVRVGDDQELCARAKDSGDPKPTTVSPPAVVQIVSRFP